jgi:hypothetical protein
MAMTPASPAPPAQGQLVSVRSGQWIVNEVWPNTLRPPAHKPSFSGPQHLLTLSSVEDDGLGEELQVIWEIESGAKVSEKVALPEPTGLDRPDHLDAMCRYVCSITDGVGGSQVPAPPPATASAHGEAQ